MDALKERMLRAQGGDQEEREKLVVENIPLVWSMVGRFGSSGKEKEELFQIGMIGLLHAIDRFDTTYDVKFSTYAVPLIIGEMRKFVRDDTPIKVSRTIVEHRKQIMALQQEKQDISVEEMARRTGLSQEDVVLALGSSQQVGSLYDAAYDSGEGEVLLIDQLQEKGKPMEQQVMEKEMVTLAMQSLSAEEEQLIRLRFFENMTQTQIGEKLHMTQVQVSRQEKRILKKMREFIKI